MTQEERKLQSIQREIEKLTAQKQKAEQRLAKKVAAAEKVGMNITEDEWLKIRDNKMTDAQYNAYFEMSLARDDLKDIEHRIEKASERSEKAGAAVRVRVERMTKEEAERLKAEEIERWAEDGITVEEMYTNKVYGTTPNGKRFCIDGNCGIHERSRHCFTLYIDGKTIFTSGEFYRAYQEVKRA